MPGKGRRADVPPQWLHSNHGPDLDQRMIDVLEEIGLARRDKARVGHDEVTGRGDRCGPGEEALSEGFRTMERITCFSRLPVSQSGNSSSPCAHAEGYHPR